MAEKLHVLFNLICTRVYQLAFVGRLLIIVIFCICINIYQLHDYSFVTILMNHGWRGYVFDLRPLILI